VRSTLTLFPKGGKNKETVGEGKKKEGTSSAHYPIPKVENWERGGGKKRGKKKREGE